METFDSVTETGHNFICHIQLTKFKALQRCRKYKNHKESKFIFLNLFVVSRPNQTCRGIFVGLMSRDFPIMAHQQFFTYSNTFSSSNIDIA